VTPLKRLALDERRSDAGRDTCARAHALDCSSIRNGDRYGVAELTRAIIPSLSGDGMQRQLPRFRSIARNSGRRQEFLAIRKTVQCFLHAENRNYWWRHMENGIAVLWHMPAL